MAPRLRNSLMIADQSLKRSAVRLRRKERSALLELLFWVVNYRIGTRMLQVAS